MIGGGAADHGCIILIKSEHVDPWLNPNAANLVALWIIRDDRPQAFPHTPASRLAGPPCTIMTPTDVTFTPVWNETVID